VRALEGRRLLICDGTRRLGTALRAELVRAGARAVLARLDERPAEAVLGGALEVLGGLDAVVIGPADATTDGSLTELTLAQWQARVTRPLGATMLLLREVLGHWLGEGEGGDVVIVHGAPGDGATAALHSGLEALVRSVAKEYGRRRVRCNLVAPSRGDVRAIVGLLELALSPAFSFVTGQTLSPGRGAS